MPSRSRSPGSTASSLLEKVRADDQEAWGRLVELYGPLIEYWGRQGSLNPQDCADLVQETFGAVWLHIAKFRRERPGDSFRGWLYRIARNKRIDCIRAEAAHPRPAGGSTAVGRLHQLPAPQLPDEEPPEPDDPADPGSERALQLRALNQIRSNFEPKTWRAFTLTVVEGMKAPAAATTLGMTAAAVRKAKSRVLQRLREYLGDLSGE